MRSAEQSRATSYARKARSGDRRALETNRVMGLGWTQRGAASSVPTAKWLRPRHGAPNLGRSERLERVGEVVETKGDASQSSFYIFYSQDL